MPNYRIGGRQQDDFLQQSLKGHNIWLNVAFSLAGPALAHLVSQRRLHGQDVVHATVLRLVPYNPSQPWWYLYARHADIKHIYKKGERIFTAIPTASQTPNPSRSLAGPCPCDVVVLRFD